MSSELGQVRPTHEEVKPTIAVICRLNQARSILVAAYLSRLLPHHTVISAGIQATDGKEIPMEIQMFAQKWGMPLEKNFSQSVESLREQILQAKFVIVAENTFAESLIDLGVSPSKIASMQDSIFDFNEIPSDPINLNNEDFEVEIAKAIMVSVQLVQRRNSFTNPHRITVVNPELGSDFGACLQSVLESAKQSGASVLVSDFRFPQAMVIEKMLVPYMELTISKSLGVITTNQNQLNLSQPALIASKYEIDFAEEFILSVKFLELLAELSKDRPVFMITGQRSSAHQHFSDSYLLCAYNSVK